MNNKKIVLITGGTNGIGKATAKGIAQTGTTIIIIGRNKQNAEKTIREIKKSSSNPNIEAIIADLSSLKEIDKLVTKITSQYTSLDVLINNIGFMSTKKETTVDGFEKVLFLNYLLPFYLTNRLLSLIQNADEGRIINLGGGIYKTGKLNPERPLINANATYKPLPSLAMAKLALVQFSFELARRLHHSKISVFVSDPGTARSGMGTKNQVWPWYFKLFINCIATTTEKAAKSTIYAAISPDLKGETGRYINAKCQSISAAKKALDKITAQKLWEKSSELLNIHYSTSHEA